MAFLQWSFNVVKFPEYLNRGGTMVRVMLTSTHRRWMIVLVLILVSATAQMVSADGEVTWYWKNETFSTPLPGHTSDKIMDQYNPIGTTDDIVTLGPNGEGWWYAENAAQCDLSFPSGNWNLVCWIETNSSDKKQVSVYIYNITTMGEKKQIDGRKAKYLNSTDGIYKLSKTFTTDSVTSLHKGDRIAIRVTFSSAAEAGDWLKIYYNSTTYSSSLTSPPNSPPWPVPELPTLALFSVGLLIIAGCAYMGRRAE